MSLLAFVIQLLPAFAILSVVVSVSPLIPHQIQSLHLHMVVNRSSDLTHIRKINSHSRSKLSKNLVGFKGVFCCNVARLHSVTHSLIAQCRLHHSISPQSVIGGVTWGRSLAASRRLD